MRELHFLNYSLNVQFSHFLKTQFNTSKGVSINKIIINIMNGLTKKKHIEKSRNAFDSKGFGQKQKYFNPNVSNSNQTIQQDYIFNTSRIKTRNIFNSTNNDKNLVKNKKILEISKPIYVTQLNDDINYSKKFITKNETKLNSGINSKKESYSKYIPIFLEARTERSYRNPKKKISLHHKDYQKNLNLLEKQYNSLHQYHITNLGLDYKINIDCIPNNSKPIM